MTLMMHRWPKSFAQILLYLPPWVRSRPDWPRRANTLYCEVHRRFDALKRLTRTVSRADTLQNKVNVPVTLHFDEMISAPCRLGILATLVPGEPVSFTEMKAATSLSDGNLHVQTRKLADVGYIRIDKVKKGKRSVTEFRITELGLDRLRLHVTKLQKVLEAETGARRAAGPARFADDSAVWA